MPRRKPWVLIVVAVALLFALSNSAAALLQDAEPEPESEAEPEPDAEEAGPARQTIEFDEPAMSQADPESEARIAVTDDPRELAVSAASGLPVDLQASGACSIEEGLFTPLALGECTIIASQVGDDNWLAAEPVGFSFTIRKGIADLSVSNLSVYTSVPQSVPEAETVPEPESVPEPETTPGPETTQEADPPTSVQTPIVSTTPADLEGILVLFDGAPDVPIEPGQYELVVTLDNERYEAEPVVGTYTVLAPQGPIAVGVVQLEASASSLQENGLPRSNPDGLVLNIHDLEPATLATLTSGDQVLQSLADGAGNLRLVIPSGFNLDEANLVLVAPDASSVAISSEASPTFGDASIDVQFGQDQETGIYTSILVSGVGLKPGSLLEAEVHAPPTKLGGTEVDAEGRAEAVYEVPDALAPGIHRVVVQGTGALGPFTGIWFVTVDESGAVVEIGDPAPLVELPEPAEEQPVPEPVIEPDPVSADFLDVNTEIHEATGLPVYRPLEHPRRSVATGVSAYALLAALTSATGGVIALSSLTPAATLSTVANKAQRSLANAKPGTHWGDGSSTWRWPGTTTLDHLSRTVPNRLRPYSPFLSRVVGDGSTSRAILGPGSLLGPLTGVLLGLASVVQTNGQAIAPSSWLVAALIVLGILDASAGAIAAVMFGVGVTLAGGITDASSVRTILALSAVWYVVAIIAGGARPFRHSLVEDWEDRWHSIADVVIGSLTGAWVVHIVMSALPGLSGLDLAIADRADGLALVGFVALLARYGLARLAMRSYSVRLEAVRAEETRTASRRQRLVAIALRALFFVFIIYPYVGATWQLWAVAVLSVAPLAFGLLAESFPNSRRLFRVVPRGVPRVLIMLLVGKTLVSYLVEQIEDPVSLTLTTFVVLSVPGFIVGVAGLFGRFGQHPEPTWPGRIAGVVVVVVTVFVVRGYFNDALAWAALAALPAVGWWSYAAFGRSRLSSENAV